MARYQKAMTDKAVYRITHADGDVTIRSKTGVIQAVAARKNGWGGSPITKIEVIPEPAWQDVTRDFFEGEELA